METSAPPSQIPTRRRSSICGRDILLIPAAAFNKGKGIVNSLEEENLSIHEYLVKVQYGFVHKNNRKDWIDSQAIDIKYDSNGFNEAVRIYVPLDCSESTRLVYILYFSPIKRGGEGFQTEARFLPIYSPVPTIPMEDPSPVFVKLPIANYAPHPFHETLYTIRLHNFLYEEQPENSGFTGVVQFVGKIKYIFYGFTEATDKEYLENTQKDIPWLNSEHEFKEEGIIDITQQQHHHNGVNTATNKGAFVMNDLWVRLPNKNTKLVFKIGFETYGGKTWEPAHLMGYHETQTFVYKPRTH